MSTGKDRSEYPELPADLGNHVEDRDLVAFSKIVIKACRTRPVMRFRSADELMTALLSFQFDSSRRQQTHVLKLWSNLIGLGGLLIGVGVVAFLLYRLLVVLK